uniref:non-specific serine/threonine protein kinase n=1 Tax=Denticeps clupeoides TaxID=299321 RepID=A0AAY4AC69_9TELE
IFKGNVLWVFPKKIIQKNFMDISVLGHGAYGRVYKAWSNKDQKNFAVKIVGNSKYVSLIIQMLCRIMQNVLMRGYKNIIEQITDGLAFIHSKKLVHRDLKVS